jgi:DNA-binding transcriptional LysR family regulator
MDPHDLDLNLLAAFATLHAERSVTRAARRRGIGQPAMSAALARLRLLFADELFIRAGRTLRPTPKAEAIAPGIAAAIAALRATLDAAAPFAPRTSTRRFTIAASDYAMLALGPALLQLLRAEAPLAGLAVIGFNKDDAARLLDDGEADLVLATFREPPARMVATRLLRESFVGLACARHRAVGADGTITLDDFLAWPHALFTMRGDMAGELDDVLARRGLARRVAFSVAHLLTLPAVLAGTDLLAAVPSRLARSLPGAAVRHFRLPVATEPWHLGMLWHPASRRDPARAWLRNAVRRAAAA